MRKFALLALCALAALPAMFAAAATTESTAVLNGAAYLRTQQKPDGSYSGALGQTMDAVFAIRSAGYDPAKETVDGKSPADYLKAQLATEARVPVLAKAALAARALGLDPRATGGVDLIAKTTAAYDSATGAYAGDDFSQSIVMIGLACTGNTVPAGAAAALVKNQIADSGGWGFGGFADPDTTAIAVQALLAAGTAKTDASITKAVAFFHATQGSDGGWGFDPSASNASSTAYVIQALIALGENPSAAGWQKDGVSPIAYLLSQQEADGSFKGFDPVVGTNQALPPLAGRTFCNAADTPITLTRPTPTATPSPTVATPTATVPTATATPPTTAPSATTAPATPSVAPRPPATGNTAVSAESNDPLLLAGGAILVLALVGAATWGAARHS
ncbi:MAG: terpene cyclase/mutase family protein [Dehalococcoidia bacterium]|nr:terpene cyclase/mutase family protein [Dehalococcoidia bacterium]